MAKHGLRTKRLRERLARYKTYMTQVGADLLEVVQRYKEQVFEATACASAVACYVPGAEIVGDSL